MRKQRDWLTEANANELSFKIRLYWLERGYHVDATIYKARGSRETSKSTDTAYGVKSNMVNGLPRSHPAHGGLYL
jgi:hypothetical protein